MGDLYKGSKLTARHCRTVNSNGVARCKHKRHRNNNVIARGATKITDKGDLSLSEPGPSIQTNPLPYPYPYRQATHGPFTEDERRKSNPDAPAVIFSKSPATAVCHNTTIIR